jgi:hypothetical protein
MGSFDLSSLEVRRLIQARAAGRIDLEEPVVAPSSLLSDGAREIEDDNAGVVEQKVDSRIEARAATDFGQDGCRYADQGTPIEREAQHSGSTRS